MIPVRLVRYHMMITMWQMIPVRLVRYHMMITMWQMIPVRLPRYHMMITNVVFGECKYKKGPKDEKYVSRDWLQSG